ncbi:hypothetical protein PUNSTDRAFT_71461, partial [Punctularia strigosozonata HHB-11173 SS5]|uniref:uncharacterized protein n=1 Tax=Punctularia strigosozonata (strain HHB-11173) TaxID=741275 RepID=UPI0004416EE5
ESIIVFPPHGLQLETHRGHPLFRLSVSRRFISMTVLQDVVINEALHGWNVRYYLAVLCRYTDDQVEIDVAFEVRSLSRLMG